MSCVNTQRFGHRSKLACAGYSMLICLFAGQRFSITDIEEVKKGIRESQASGRKGKYFLEG